MSGDESLPGEFIIDLEKADNRRLLEFYLGGMDVGPATDPFLSGLVREEEGTYFISKNVLVEGAPTAVADIDRMAEDGTVTWDEFESFVLANYYTYRGLPATVDNLIELAGDWSDGAEWMKIPVKGVMSPYHRVVHVKYEAVYAALSGYRTAGNVLIYPVGTTFVSEHMDGEKRVEISAMRKRDDGYWDFFAYDVTDRLTTQLEKSPRPLDVPVKCVGCHFGTRLFEPEKSFPAAARTGPDGPRGIFMDEPLPAISVVNALDEHRKRSDQVLGLYATLLLNRLTHLQEDGELDRTQQNILDLFREIL